MLRSAFRTATFALALQTSALAAQQTVRWGDELGAALPPVNSLPGAAGQPPRWPAPPLLDPPKPLRAIYVNAWAFGGRRLDELVKLADTTEINAFVIDVKDDTGYLTYRSAVPTAVEIGANDQHRTHDTERRLRVLAQHGIHPIARIVVAKDPLLASRKPAWSVQRMGGGLWRDRLNFAWVDAFNDSVWIYAAQLAEEAVRMGFAEVQYDYVRFPDATCAIPTASRITWCGARWKTGSSAPARWERPPRFVRTCKRLRSDHRGIRPPRYGRKCGPRRTWASIPGCSGTHGVPTTPRSSAEGRPR